MRIGHLFGWLFAYIGADSIVQEKVKLDGKVCFDGVCAIARAVKGRLSAPALLPKVVSYGITYLTIVNIRNE